MNLELREINPRETYLPVLPYPALIRSTVAVPLNQLCAGRVTSARTEALTRVYVSPRGTARAVTFPPPLFIPGSIAIPLDYRSAICEAGSNPHALAGIRVIQKLCDGSIASRSPPLGPPFIARTIAIPLNYRSASRATGSSACAEPNPRIFKESGRFRVRRPGIYANNHQGSGSCYSESSGNLHTKPHPTLVVNVRCGTLPDLDRDCQLHI